MTPTEWSNCLKQLRWYSVYVSCIFTTDKFAVRRFQNVGTSPGSAAILRTLPTGDSKSHLIVMENNESLFKDRPTVENVLYVLHEAAHVILNDFSRDENEGLAQVELLLAWMISKPLWKWLFISQRDNYHWEVSYDYVRRSQSWKNGERRALRRMAYLPDERKELLGAFKKPRGESADRQYPQRY